MVRERRQFAIAFVLVLGAIVPCSVQADDEPLVLMNEPTSFTDVIDAFDDHDPFDVNLTLAYLRTWEFGRIQRENPTSGDHRMSRDWLDVGDYSHEINQLVVGLDVGIFRDLALYGRLPLILSDDRSIASVGGTGRVEDRGPDGASNPPLFDLSSTFRSPTRSGVDYLALGIAWSILNQHRDRNVPTWMWMLEGRFNLGDPMRACGPNGMGGFECLGTDEDPDTLALRRNGSPGVGRGTNALRIETRGSFRYEYIEPYAGLAFQIEWPGYGSGQFLPQGNLAGYINDLPPILGRLTVGSAIIPWEDREHFQRFSIDLRFLGEYWSEGHDYSPLFDALGSSRNPYLTHAVLEGQPTDGDPNGQAGLERVHFYGLTDVQSRTRFGGQLTLEMQAARYVRFALSATLLHTPSYGITIADACNPNVTDPPRGDQRLRGTCRSGIINPHHRPVIDLPGQRFRMASTTQVDLMASVTAQF